MTTEDATARPRASPAARVLLIRHAHTNAIGHRLVSRAPGVSLSDAGRAQARALAARLARLELAAVFSSPLERARETAHAIAAPRHLDVRVCGGLDEVDFGEWTGKTFTQLADIAGWHEYNARRSAAVIPGGESARDVQRRIVRAIRRLHREYPGQTIAAVSHADVIRAAVLYCAATPLDLWRRFEISPASVTVVAVDQADMRLWSVNDTAAELG
jgi:probable phosphoglycerate mutase